MSVNYAEDGLALRSATRRVRHGYAKARREAADSAPPNRLHWMIVNSLHRVLQRINVSRASPLRSAGGRRPCPAASAGPDASGRPPGSRHLRIDSHPLPSSLEMTQPPILYCTLQHWVWSVPQGPHWWRGTACPKRSQQVQNRAYHGLPLLELSQPHRKPAGIRG
jgi:hypothetical protein